MRSVRNCNVAVIGGAGFLGSHCVDHLVEDRGCQVTVIDNLCAGRREFAHPKARFVYHDITGSEEWLRRLFVDHQIKYVLNYASWPYIPDSFARPAHVINVNLNGAVKVINAAQEAGCEAILQVSSAEIYGEGCPGHYHGIKITEESKVIPHSSYGVSKAAVDSYVVCRWKEAKTPCIALRQFNCVGPRETHPYIVPEIIGQLKAKGPAYGGEVAHGDPIPTVKLGNNSFRDFLYSGDQARIAVELLERGQFGECYNLGSESGIKMYDLAKLIGKVMGFADVRVEHDPARDRPYEIWHLLSDNAKLWKVIDRKDQPIFVLKPLEEALRRTVEWYRGNGCRWPWEDRG